MSCLQAAGLRPNIWKDTMANRAISPWFHIWQTIHACLRVGAQVPAASLRKAPLGLLEEYGENFRKPPPWSGLAH